MTKNTQLLIEEIKSAPENVQKEVLDFLLFLKSKTNSDSEKTDDLLPLAQSAWAADWDSPKEDEAWRDL